eukprot:1378711-Prorocentrum_lima.AAC.1
MDRTSVPIDQRLGHEAGMGKHKVALVGQDGKEITLSLHLGLPFMEWDDFANDVREKLAKSHLAGRHQAP